MTRVWEATKRDVKVTTACLDALKKMESDATFSREEAKRKCADPEANPKKPDDFTITCNASSSWLSACNSAGGDVCAMEAKGHGKYGGDATNEGDYLVHSLLCVPLACKKDDNIRDYIWDRTKVWCPTYGFKACSMTINCNHVPPSKTLPIVLALFGFLTLVGGILALVYVVYSRYRANTTYTEDLQVAEPFIEHDELSHNETGDVEIDDNSLGHDGEEEDHRLD